MSLRALAEVPAAWMSKRPASIEAALTSTSGGWITGPTLVSAASSASTHGRDAGNSALIRWSPTLEREPGNTPTGRLAARTGAATVAGPVLRARNGSVPVSANASGSVAPARASARAMTKLPSVPGVSSTTSLPVSRPASRVATSSWLVAGSGTITTSAPASASPMSVVALSRRAAPWRSSAASVIVPVVATGASSAPARRHSRTRWPASARSAAVA